MEVDRLMVNLENEMREGFGDLYTDSYDRRCMTSSGTPGRCSTLHILTGNWWEQALSSVASGATLSPTGITTGAAFGLRKS